MITTACVICKKSFLTTPYDIKVGRGKYCSYACLGASKRRGAYHICLICKKSFYIVRCRVKNGEGKYCSKSCTGIFTATRMMDKKNPMWKGEAVGLNALHEWVKNRLQKPSLCESCRVSPPVDLANISQLYKRDLLDWEWLCRKCHMQKDGRLGRLSQVRNARLKKVAVPDKVCPVCKVLFHNKKRSVRCCSLRCRNLFRYGRYERT